MNSMGCLLEYPLYAAMTFYKKSSHDQLWHQLNSLTAQGRVEQPKRSLLQGRIAQGRGSGERSQFTEPISAAKLAWWFVLRRFERECLIDNPCLAVIILMSIWIDEMRQAKKKGKRGRVMWSVRVSLKTGERENWMAVALGPGSRSEL